jgi:hypothetical protein
VFEQEIQDFPGIYQEKQMLDALCTVMTMISLEIRICEGQKFLESERSRSG